MEKPCFFLGGGSLRGTAVVLLLLLIIIIILHVLEGNVGIFVGANSPWFGETCHLQKMTFWFFKGGICMDMFFLCYPTLYFASRMFFQRFSVRSEIFEFIDTPFRWLTEKNTHRVT